MDSVSTFSTILLAKLSLKSLICKKMLVLECRDYKVDVANVDNFSFVGSCKLMDSSIRSLSMVVIANHNQRI